MAILRRDLLTAGWAALAATQLPNWNGNFEGHVFAQEKPTADAKDITFGCGLVTYMWGADWDLPTLIKNCQDTGLKGVELRTTHAHKVEPTLNEMQREEVRKQFEDSSVTLVGIGSDERFDNPDPAVVSKAIEATKAFIRLSHDIGGSGVKVKPDKFHDSVPHEKTVEQIGKALNELGEYAAGFGQQVRLEVHGQVGADIPAIKAIMEIAKDDNVALCWNSNVTDLKGDGFEKNFATLRPRFGQTLHVRELDSKDYPFDQLIALLVKSEYEGFVLLEAASKPADRLVALAEQVKLFNAYVEKALKG